MKGIAMKSKTLIPVILAAGVIAAPMPALASAELANAKNCGACHAMDKKRIGPSYQAIAEKYANDRGAEPKLARKVREGGVGVWGQVPMPANPQVSPDEAAALTRWILSVRK
jgi:cytochrome c